MAQLSWIDPSVDENRVRTQLSEMMKRDARSLTHGGDELKTIYIFLTRKCNLGCQHCYIEGVGPKARDFDFNFETIKGLVDQALPHGLRKVKVSGGEPLIHSEAMEILNYLGSVGLREIVLETNGTLFKPDTIEKLSKIPNLVVFISLDHIEEGVHDEFRGRTGAYGRTTAILKELGKTSINSVVTTTAYRKNYNRVPEIIDAVLGWGISKHRTLLNIHPLGNARGHLDNAITLDECEQLIATLLTLPAFKSGRAYMTLPPALMPLEYLNGVHTCGWGDSVLGILSNGDISMCSASYDDPEMIGGNVRDGRLMDIWRDSPFFQKLRTIGEGEVKGVCSNCVFYSACRGVCKMSSYSHYGEKDAPYPLCQEVYNSGAFPRYALIDPDVDCSYRPNTIKPTRKPRYADTELAYWIAQSQAERAESPQ
jgi:AdoMet-dependent heme synthase